MLKSNYFEVLCCCSFCYYCCGGFTPAKMHMVPTKLEEFLRVVPQELIGAMCWLTVGGGVGWCAQSFSCPTQLQCCGWVVVGVVTKTLEVYFWFTLKHKLSSNFDK